MIYTNAIRESPLGAAKYPIDKSTSLVVRPVLPEVAIARIWIREKGTWKEVEASRRKTVELAVFFLNSLPPSLHASLFSLTAWEPLLEKDASLAKAVVEDPLFIHNELSLGVLGNIDQGLHTEGLWTEAAIWSAGWEPSDKPYTRFTFAYSRDTEQWTVELIFKGKEIASFQHSSLPLCVAIVCHQGYGHLSLKERLAMAVSPSKRPF